MARKPPVRFALHCIACGAYGGSAEDCEVRNFFCKECSIRAKVDPS